MSKALKIVGTVVAVVAFAASVVVTGGATALVALGVSATTAATIVGIAATVATIAGLAAAGIAIASSFIKPPGYSQGGTPLDFVTNPQSPLPYGIGRTRMSGLKIHGGTAEGSNSKIQNDVLAFAVLLSAGGMIQGIDSFRADKVPIAFNSSTGQAVGSYAGFMSQKVSLGGSTALSLTLNSASMPGWTANHKLSGMAHALWMLQYDSKETFYTGGVPEPEWIGRWVLAYDPRKDSTYPGGSGSHRPLQESTYEWTRNGALHALTWALGRVQNSKRTLGIGAPLANIRVADFVTAANLADTNNWKAGGFAWSTDSKWGVLKQFLQSCGAVPTMTGAMIGCMVNAPRVSITTISSVHLLNGLSIAITKSRRDRFNTVVPRFRSENHEWEIITGTPIKNTTYITEDGSTRSKEVDFPFVQHELVDGVNGNTQVGQLAAYMIVNSREAGPISFTTGPQFIGIKSGDCVTLDVPEEGIVSQPVIIQSVSIDPANATIAFTAETETAGKHSFALGQATTPPPAYVLTPKSQVPDAPASSVWSITSANSIDGLPAITITGANEYSTGTDVVIQYRAVGAAAWQAPAVFSDPRGTIKHEIVPLEGNTAYEAQVAYRNTTAQGSWLALGPVTTSLASAKNPAFVTIAEKLIIIPQEAARTDRYTKLRARMVVLSLSVTALDQANSDWLVYRNSLSPAWNVTTANSPVIRGTWESLSAAYDTQLNAADKAISEEDAKRATWSVINGTGKPADNATNDRFQDTRATNQPPSWYYTNYAYRTANEFKDSYYLGFSGIPSAGTYGALVSIVDYADPSGGPVKQEFTFGTSYGTYASGQKYTRNGTGSSWSPWYKSFSALLPPRLGSGGEVLTEGGAAIINTDVLNNALEGSVLRIPSPVGGAFSNGVDNVPGAIKIELPAGAANNTMVRFFVDVYEYGSEASQTYEVGGYAYGAGNWLNCFCNATGRSTSVRPVRFGNEGGKWCVFIGNAAGTWRYPSVRVRDFQASYSNFTEAAWATGWVVSLKTSAFGTIDQTVTQPVAGDALIGLNTRRSGNLALLSEAEMLNESQQWSQVSGAARPADYATSDIVLINSGTGVVVAGNAVSRPTGGGDWTGQAFTPYGYTGGAFCSFTFDINAYAMVGLNSDPTTDANYTSLDHAWYCAADSSSIAIVEFNNGGTYPVPGTITASTVLSVVYDNEYVRYLKDGVEVRAVYVGAGKKFHFDSSIVQGTGFRNIRFGPYAAANAPVSFTHTGNHSSAGNSVFKNTAAAFAWDSKSVSREISQGTAFVSGKFDTFGTFIGLHEVGNAATNYNSLSYGWHWSSGTSWYIFEDGAAPVGPITYAVGTQFTITYDGVNVRYYAGSALVRTVATTANRSFQAGVACYAPDNRVSGVQFGPYTDRTWSNIAGTGKPENNADVTITAQVTTEAPANVTINADYTGAIVAGQFNKTLTPVVLRGGVDSRINDRASYTVTSVTGGLATYVSVNNTAASADKGRVTVTNCTSSGTFTLNIFWDGVLIASYLIKFTVVAAAAPTGGGGGGGTKSGTFSAVGTILSTTSFVVLGQINNLTKAAGETIRCTFPNALYETYALTNQGRVCSAKWQYSPTGANTWTDFAAAVNGTSSFYSASTYYADPGEITVNQNSAPANAAYDVRLVANMTTTGSSSNITFTSGTGSIAIGV